MRKKLDKHAVMFCLLLVLSAVSFGQVNMESAAAEFDYPRVHLNCLNLRDRSCNLISNNNFTPAPCTSSMCYDETIQLHGNDPFGLGFVTGWYPSHGTPQIPSPTYNPGSVITPPSPATGSAWMFAAASPTKGEGIVQNIPKLKPGETYAFSFFRGNIELSYGTSTLDEFNIYLLHCDDFGHFNTNSYSIPTPPVHSQQIFGETNLNSLSTWEQVFVSFLADEDYDMIWIFPKHTTGTGSGSLSFAYPELLQVNKMISVESLDGCEKRLRACSIANAEYSWTGPNGFTSNSQDITVTDNYASYTLQVTVPGAVTTNNVSSTNNPVLSINTVLPGGNLDFATATMRYLKNTTAGNTYITQTLSDCEDNNLCESFIGGEEFDFSGSSNINTGNTWDVRTIAVSPYTLSGGIITNSSVTLPLSSTFQTFSTGQTATFHSNVAASAVFWFEIRLTNSILGQTKYINIRNVFGAADGDTGPIYCISTSPTANYPHKVVGGTDAPGFSYLWTVPSITGLSVITPLNQHQLEYDDASVNYSSYPNATATLAVSNTFGCPSHVYTLHLTDECSDLTRAPIVNTPFKPLEENKGLLLYPNPATSAFQVKGKKTVQLITIRTVEGKLVRAQAGSADMFKVNVADLSKGSYIVEITFSDKSKQSGILVKN